MQSKSSQLHLSSAPSIRNRSAQRSMHASSETRTRRTSSLVLLGIWAKRVWYTLLFTTIAASLPAGWIAWQTWNNMHAEKQLQALDAFYTWNHETYNTQANEKPSPLERALASTFGNALASNLAVISLTKGDPGDQDLSFLATLSKLRTLDLRSNIATDKTIGLISKLPDLRYLSLAGNKFSIFGLLQLRHAHNLRQLTIDTDHFSDLELAVLKHELPGVTLLPLQKKSTEAYPQRNSSPVPVA